MHALLHSVPPALQSATADLWLHWRLLHTHGQVWVNMVGSLLFLLGASAHKVLFVPFKSLFSQSCESSGGSMVGLMVTSSKKAYAIPGLLHRDYISYFLLYSKLLQNLVA